MVKEQRGNTIVAHRFDEHNDINIHVFVGTERQARDLAMRDTDEFVVTDITAWRGNLDSKNTLLFYVTYADGSRLWQPVGGKAADISRTQVFCGNRDLGTRKRDLENQILTKGSKYPGFEPLGIFSF